MKPLNERRHRLQGDEVPKVIEGLRLRLKQRARFIPSTYNRS